MGEGSQPRENKVSQAIIKNKNGLTFFGAQIADRNRDLSWLKESEQSNKYKRSFSKDDFDKASILSNKLNKSNLSLLNTSILDERYKRNAKECELAIYVASVNSKKFKVGSSDDNKENHYSEESKNMLNNASKNQDHCNQEINDIEKWMNGKDLVLSTIDPARS